VSSARPLQIDRAKERVASKRMSPRCGLSFLHCLDPVKTKEKAKPMRSLHSHFVYDVPKSLILLQAGGGSWFHSSVG